MKKAFMFTLLCILIGGCISSTQTAPLANPPSKASLPTNTTTSLSPTITPKVFVIPTNTPEIITKTCPEAKNDLFTENIEGTVILNGAYLIYDKSLGYLVLHPGSAYMWDIKNDQKIDVFREKDEELLSFFTSPNRKWFVYSARKYDGTGHRIAIMGHDGKLIRNIARHGWLAPLGWQDDKNLAVWVLDNAKYGLPFPTLIYNPFTRDSKLIPPDYPNISVWRSISWPETQTVYDPSLRYVVYVTNPDSTGISDVILWRIQDKKELARLKHLVVLRNNNAPLWSLNGQEFLIDAKLEGHLSFELYTIKLDGEVEQLTNFEHFMPQQHIELWDYSWSGDGRYIAFWYDIDNQGDYQLAILDTSNSQISNLCLSSKWHDAPIWSPDNKQFLVNIVNENDDLDKNHVLLIDFQNESFAEIATGVLAEGWLSSLP